MKKLLVLQHEGCNGLGSLERFLLEDGFEFETLFPPTSEMASVALGSYAGLIILGGPMGVYERDQYPWLNEELALIRRFIDAGTPVFGICLGSQLAAAALGADVHPNGRQEIGWFDVAMSEDTVNDPLLHGLPRTFPAFHWHGDTFELPHNAVRLASSTITKNQAFRFGKVIYGLQFHLEMDLEKLLVVFESMGDRVATINHQELDAQTRIHDKAHVAMAGLVFRRWLAMCR
jgi:GMP synthase (glutamine-hydrolysing)